MSSEEFASEIIRNVWGLSGGVSEAGKNSEASRTMNIEDCCPTDLSWSVLPRDLARGLFHKAIKNCAENQKYTGAFIRMVLEKSCQVQEDYFGKDCGIVTLPVDPERLICIANSPRFCIEVNSSSKILNDFFSKEKVNNSASQSLENSEDPEALEQCQPKCHCYSCTSDSDAVVSLAILFLLGFLGEPSDYNDAFNIIEKAFEEYGSVLGGNQLGLHKLSLLIRNKDNINGSDHEYIERVTENGIQAGDPLSFYVRAVFFEIAGDLDYSMEMLEGSYALGLSTAALRRAHLLKQKGDMTGYYEWLMVSCEDENPSALVEAGKLHLTAEYIDSSKAIDLLEKATSNGNVDAYSDLLRLYVRGIGTMAPDFNLSNKYQVQGAIMGNPDCQHKLGQTIQIVSKGLDSQDVHPNARLWFERASAQGHVDSLLQMGFLCTIGQNPGENNKAYDFYSSCFEKGNAEAALQIAKMYVAGNGVDKDDSKAYEWTRKAALRESAKGYFMLALMHKTESGTYGVDFSISKFEKLLKRSASLGFDQAQAMLAQIYLSREVSKEPNRHDKDAVLLLEKSAAGGNVEAMHLLGCCLISGKGVSEPDIISGCMWLAKAMALEHNRAKQFLSQLVQDPQLMSELENRQRMCTMLRSLTEISVDKKV